MKYLLSLILVGMLASATFAQSEYKAEHEGWLVSLDEAYQLSQKTGKPIMANFTGSDWCGWCKRLTAAVFSKDEFKSWAEENVVLLELDFPKRKQLPQDVRKQNSDLQRAFGVRGYPTVWVFNVVKDENSEFKINALGKTGYKASVNEFTSTVETFLAKSGS